MLVDEAGFVHEILVSRLLLDLVLRVLLRAQMVMALVPNSSLLRIFDELRFAELL